MRCAAIGSNRYDETNRSTACRNSLASFSRCCLLLSSRPRLLPRLLLRLRFFFSFFCLSAPKAGGAAPKGNGAFSAAGAGARWVGAKGSTASTSGGASSSAFLAFLARAAFASLPPRRLPVFFFDAGFLGCAIWPMGTSSSSESSSFVACACNCEMGTSSSSLESFAGAGAGASLSASSSFAFRLVTRVPPRRPRAIVLAFLALRVNANSHARRATGSKIACATSSMIRWRLRARRRPVKTLLLQLLRRRRSCVAPRSPVCGLPVCRSC